MKKKSKPKGRKPAQSFKLGEDYRKKLKELSEFRDETQVDIIRQVIDTLHRGMRQRQHHKSREFAKNKSWMQDACDKHSVVAD